MDIKRYEDFMESIQKINEDELETAFWTEFKESDKLLAIDSSKVKINKKTNIILNTFLILRSIK